MPKLEYYTSSCPMTTDDKDRDALMLKVYRHTLNPSDLPKLKAPRQTWGTYHARLIKAAAQHGIVDPTNALNAAVYTGVNFSVVCTSLLMESWGGKNVWGGDPGGDALPSQWFEHPVTPSEWNVYWANVKRGLTTNGCGGMQLTSEGLQQSANNLGGCWLPGPNFKVGAIFMRQLLAEVGDNVERAYQDYNGSGSAAIRYGQNAAALEAQLHWVFEACR